MALSLAMVFYPSLASRHVYMHCCLLDTWVTEGATVAPKEGEEHEGNGEAASDWLESMG